MFRKKSVQEWAAPWRRRQVRAVRGRGIREESMRMPAGFIGQLGRGSLEMVGDTGIEPVTPSV
jgi:hypothetical protein